jgi:hypothetical protein
MSPEDPALGAMPNGSFDLNLLARGLERAERLGGRRLAQEEAKRLRLEGAGPADGEFTCHEFVDPEGNPVQILKR